jgi:hypothetical protein
MSSITQPAHPGFPSSGGWSAFMVHLCLPLALAASTASRGIPHERAKPDDDELRRAAERTAPTPVGSADVSGGIEWCHVRVSTRWVARGVATCWEHV